MSWYRKYRPMTFSDLVGQEQIRKILLTALQKGTAVHALLFSGPRGTGKTSAARIFGKALNCLNPTDQGEPCNACDNCRDINESRFVDMIEIDAASNTGVDHIRDLREKIGFAPTSGKAKVYIIDEVHMLSMGAFNALLKTLEEPPEFVYFVLATTEIHKVPATIQSRCQRFSFRRLNEQDIVQRLLHIAKRENIQTEEDALEIIAHRAGGGLRDAISLFEQQAVNGEVTTALLEAQLGLVTETLLRDFFAALDELDTRKALDLLDELVAEGFSLSEFLREVLLFLRQKLLTATEEKADTDRLLFLLEIFDEAQRKMKFAMIPQLPLEIAIVKATGEDKPEEEKPSRGLLGIFGGEKRAAEKKSAGKKEGEEKAEKEEETEKPESKEEAKNPSKDAEFLAPELNLQGVRTAWSKILEKLENSLLRMSLRNAEIVSIEDNVLHLQFPAETWKEKVEETKNEQEFLKAFEEIFSQKVRLELTVKSVQLEPAIIEKEFSEKNPKKDKPQPVEMLEEIMGAKARKAEEK